MSGNNHKWINKTNRHFSPNLNQIGISGLKRSGGYIYEEFHPRLRGKRAIEVFREMADNDAVCGCIIRSHTSIIGQAKRELKAADDSLEALFYKDKIESMFGDCEQTESERMQEILSMCWAGYSIFAKNWKQRRKSLSYISPANYNSKYDDGLYAPRRILGLSQDSIEEWKFSKEGNIEGAWQMAWPDFKRELIPAEYILLYRVDAQKNNPEGKSILRNAYRSWWFLKRIQELEAIGVERDMAGLMVMRLPPEFFADNASTAQKNTVEAFRKIAERARRNEYDGLLYPAGDTANGKTGWDVSLLQSGGRRPMDVDAIVKRLESRIALSVLGESVLLGMQGNVGSWSLASSKTHMMALVIQHEMSVIDDIDNRFLIPDIMKANGWPEEAAPSFAFGDIETDDATELMSAIVSGVSGGVISLDDGLEEYMRQRMGLPQKEKVDFTSGRVQDAIGSGVLEQTANKTDQILQNIVPIKQEVTNATS